MPHGCFFQWTKRILKELQELGLKHQYSDDDNICTSGKKLMDLAFMPHENMEVVFNQIKDDVVHSSDPLMDQLMCYVNEHEW